MKTKLMSFRISQPDRTILETIAAVTGFDRTQVIRMAIRYYGIYGPWTAEEAERLHALRHTTKCPIVGLVRGDKD